MTKTFTVYMHKNKINDKKYIGMTSQKPVKRRWRQGSCYNKCPKIYTAIKKYGWENFESIILFENLTKQQAEKKEIETIEFYKTTNIDFGYNTLKGGNLSNTGIKFTEEHKKKISIANSGEKNGNYGKKGILSPRFGIKIKKEDSPMYGKKHSQNAKEKMRKAHLGMKPSNRKKTLCIETGIIYDSTHEVQRMTGISYKLISACCTGKNKTAGGYHWKYVE